MESSRQNFKPADTEENNFSRMSYAQAAHSNPSTNYQSTSAQNPRIPNSKTSTQPITPEEDDSNSSNNNNNNNHNNHYTPRRKCAIVLENTHNVTQDQCLRAVADIISGANIQYCSRLSGGRICLYLTSETHVERLVEESGVTINSEFIPVRKYVSEATKYVISNCPPEMNDEDLKIILEPYGKIVSAPTRLRVSTIHEDLKHIKTWRRSIYMIKSHNSPEVPQRIIVTTTEGIKQTLYIDKDELLCAFCNRPGHTVEKCKKKAENEKDFPTFRPPQSHRLIVNTKRRENSTNQEKSKHQESSRIEESSRDQETTTSLQDNQTCFMPQFSTKPANNPNSNNLDSNMEDTSSIWGDILQDKQTSQPLKNFSQHLATLNLSSTLSSPAKQTTEQEIESTSSSSKSYNEIIVTEEEESDCSISSVITANLTSNELFTLVENKKQKKRVLSPQESSVSKIPKKIDSLTMESPEDKSLENSDAESSNSQQTKKEKGKRSIKEEYLIESIVKKITFIDSEVSEQSFKLFMLSCRGKANAPQTLKKLNLSAEHLLPKLNQAYLLCTEQNLQRRFKRAIDALSSPSNGI
jgi:hypothetical protein